MLDERVRGLAWAWTALWLVGCAEPQWARLSWPSEVPGQLEQPEARADPLGLRLSARAITWEPAGLVVELTLSVEGAPEQALVVEPGLVFLAYDGLEYAPEIVDPDPRAPSPSPSPSSSSIVADPILLAEGEAQTIVLRYSLGRALTGPGARLVLRGLRRGDEPLVELPELAVPAMPAQARPTR